MPRTSIATASTRLCLADLAIRPALRQELHDAPFARAEAGEARIVGDELRRSVAVEDEERERPPVRHRGREDVIVEPESSGELARSPGRVDARTAGEQRLLLAPRAQLHRVVAQTATAGPPRSACK